MNKSKFKTSKESGPHLRLLNLIGDWDGNTRTWLEKDTLADESPTNGKISALLNKRFIRYEYHGSINGKAHEGLMVWGYDIDNNQCVCSWIDSFHMGTAIMFSKGEEHRNGFTVNGEYTDTELQGVWGWRTELEILNLDQFIIRAFHISPTGEEIKAIETINLRIEL